MGFSRKWIITGMGQGMGGQHGLPWRIPEAGSAEMEKCREEIVYVLLKGEMPVSKGKWNAELGSGQKGMGRPLSIWLTTGPAVTQNDGPAMSIFNVFIFFC